MSDHITLSFNGVKYSLLKLLTNGNGGPLIEIDPAKINRDVQFECEEEHMSHFNETIANNGYPIVLEHENKYVIVVGDKSIDYTKAKLLTKPRLRKARIEESEPVHLTKILADHNRSKDRNPYQRDKFDKRGFNHANRVFRGNGRGR